MPFTSSVFPVPRSPSSAMMSPGSRTCPRRRPSSCVSSTEAVSTKMFIACSEAWNNDELPVDAYPNAATALEGADDRELEVEVTAQTPACRFKQGPRRGAKKFIVLGLHQPARPCVLAAPPKIRVQW